MNWKHIRTCSNGRHEVQCDTCHRFAWLNDSELARWTECPHCLGWVTHWPATDTTTDD
jgi:hypothetical protein